MLNKQQKEQEPEQKKLEKIALQLEQQKNLKVVNLKAGKGGFGDVMIVQDAELNLYAVKSILIFDGVDEVCKKKLADAENEAKILKHCDHPNIVKYKGEFQIGINYFILMEKCEMSLQDFVDQKQAITRDRFINIAKEMIEAIQYLHSQNLILRDISLKNILLDKHNKIKLCDFGLAKQIDPFLATQAFRTSIAKGTKSYFPPEILDLIIDDKKDKQFYQTREGDIWSYGICLYFLAGVNPIYVFSFTQGDKQFEKQDQVDEDINHFISLILQRDPKNRPSVEQIIKHLVQLQSVNEPVNPRTIHYNNDVEVNSYPVVEQNQEKDQINKNQIDEEIECYKKVIQLDPNYLNAYSSLGAAYFNKKMLPESIECYKKAIELDPDNPAHYAGIALVYKDLNLKDEELLCELKITSLQPIDSDSQNRLDIQNHQRKMLLDQAVNSYQKAIQLGSIKNNIHFNLGMVYFDKNMLDESIACYKMSILLNPKCLDSYRNLGLVYLKQQMYEQSINCFKKAIELDPDNAFLYQGLGLVYSYKQQLDTQMADKAIECYTKAIELNSVYADFHYNLGITYYYKKMLDQSIACYLKAIELNHTYLNAYFNLGLAYKEQKLLNKK